MISKFTPPKLIGTDSEKLEQLQRWLNSFIESLNVAMDDINMRTGG